MLASATKGYKKFMRQAAKATSDYKREEYLAAALSGLVVTGVVASKLMANLEGKKAAAPGPARKKLGRMSRNCERCRHLGAVQLAESTSSCSTSAVHCCAHSEQLNMSRLQPGVPVREMSYSRIARPQLGHAGVLATGCSDDLNKLIGAWHPSLHFLQIRRNGTRSVIGLPRVACLAGVYIR